MKNPILHIVVVGFHHKKGCQVEFSYPPLISGTEGKNECPSGWKYLPTLALPDGSHNFTEDTVFFNVPSLHIQTESVYGVSCYRQISVEKLKIRTADVTRSTVQKSVCVLAELPLYGYIEVKLSLIADAFFEQGDFSCTEILVEAYEQLNACLLHELNPMRHVEVGLPLRDIVLKWRHKTLLLFKLMLLQRRVVCFSSPVRQMCTLILGIASLHSKLLEAGFHEVCCVRTSRPLSPMPDFTNRSDEEPFERRNDSLDTQQEKIAKSDIFEANSVTEEPLHVIGGSSSCSDDGLKRLRRESSSYSDKNFLPRDASIDTLACNIFPLSSIKSELWNAPLPIFSSGNLCLPYLSLPYMDLLSDPSVLSYIIGTSNILFHQKKNLADMQIDIEGGSIETNDPELRRQLVLTFEDLRFIDYVIRNVQNPKEDAEGSEIWIREQFKGYSLALLKSSLQENSKDCENFNGSFMSAWKKTQCFQEWFDARPDDTFFETVPSGHPFAGTLSVSDMKLKIAQTMQNSESGRKLNQAVNTTSRAVGVAISHAKGAVSSWWSSMTVNPVGVSENDQKFESVIDPPILETSDFLPSGTDTIESKSNIENVAYDACEAVKEITDNFVDEITNNGLMNSRREEGIIEIAKEAEILDRDHHNPGEVFTV